MAGKKKDEALFGFDVVGEDGRRISRGLPETEARNEANRISSATGEDIAVVAADGPAPSVPGLAPNPDFPPAAETLKDPSAE